MKKLFQYSSMCFIAILFVITISAANSIDESKIIESDNNDTIGIMHGDFDMPELPISPSPDDAKWIQFSLSEKVIAYEVSPAGANVASLVQERKKFTIKFWQIGANSFSNIIDLPEGLIPTSMTWHPKANALFVMGKIDKTYQILKIDLKDGKWNFKSIYASIQPIKNMVVCPRPFITDYGSDYEVRYYCYRLFFGMDNGDKSFRIVSINENGNRFYQVIGPSATKTEIPVYADAPPSEMESDWALPISFHPSGSELIWESKKKQLNVASYNSKYWGNTKTMTLPIENIGTITAIPNGLGFIHWQNNKSGIGVYLLSTKMETRQLEEFQFCIAPSSVPDGKGIVGLTILDSKFTLHYLPIEIPLPDVVNAWMFVDTTEEINHFVTHKGLFRTSQDDQLYQLYETENYYCGSYDMTTPTRPYLVTTDIFWELFGAAYQGLFIVKERDEAIPNFWKFIQKANEYLTPVENAPTWSTSLSAFNNLNSNSCRSSWKPIFTVLTNLKNGNINDPEVIKIINLKDDYNAIINDNYPYSDLKPRGHYTSSPEMMKYFEAFRYFTTIYKANPAALNELNNLPKEITQYAEKWIDSYSGFIAPSRSPIVLKNKKNEVPNYCQFPKKDSVIFPLSWGFDNEILYSTVYHENLPSELQVTGIKGPRLMPSGIDMAASLGNSFAEKILSTDYEKYPPLRKVINNLKENYKINANNAASSNNLYSQWINGIAVQWADTLPSANKNIGDKDIWMAKRLQTGLATWATLRHATILVNERTAAECGEGGFEEILMRTTRGYVEPDPQTFAAIAGLFESAKEYVSQSLMAQIDIREDYDAEKRSLYEGIMVRLSDAVAEAKSFQSMAEKEIKGEELSNEECENIFYVARIAEHLFLVFNSLSNKDYALSTPDPMAKIADVAGGGILPYLMSAVGNPMEWDYIVPYYGRHQIVKGSIYSYYEFQSEQLWNDQEWRAKVQTQEFLPWIKPYITNQKKESYPATNY